MGKRIAWAIVVALTAAVVIATALITHDFGLQKCTSTDDPQLGNEYETLIYNKPFVFCH